MLGRTRPALTGFAALALVACAEGSAGDHTGHDDAHDPVAQAGETAGRADARAIADANAGLRPALGLMTSLPLYWPLGADFADLAGGTAESPWQRGALEQRYELVPLDTLSPIPALTAGAPDEDPLAGLDHIAIIQPRGLSPADNVALDQWVRGGGKLLLVLDPALTGHYDLPLGDPAMPSLAALIPPVVARWGMEVRYDEAQAADPQTIALAGGTLPVWLSGTIERMAPRAAEGPQACTLMAQATLSQCRIGEGRVTLLADAALFEHRGLAGEANAAISLVLRTAFAD